MNLDELQRKLLAAGRATVPRDDVPYAFEKRITALLRARPALDPTAFWARALLRAVAPCAAVMLALGAWTWFHGTSTSESTDDFSQQFEQALTASEETL